MITRWWLAIAGLSGVVAVAVEALARHGAGADLHRVELAATGAQYALFHAPALLAVCALARGRAPGWARHLLHVAGWGFAAGLVLFSGSLYWLGLGLPSIVASLTPVGGLAFMVGWAALVAAALVPRGERD
ncbi:MAG TPA: DUF423 domain-containing protein [Stellaceae bacterium]|nr:DUF423 domain-containing protein [Stellaceae bacterium]